MKKVLKILGALVGLVVLGAGAYVFVQVRAYGASMGKVYDLPPLAITASTEPAVIERGKHLVESLGGCADALCHGPSLSGGRPLEMGPLATIRAPNITPAGVIGQYSDGELGRLLVHAIKKDGRSVTFMPVTDINWWPDDDVAAVVSYLRTVPPVEHDPGRSDVSVLGKVLDRRDAVLLDIARRIDHGVRHEAPAPAPTALYGSFVARSCTGCHGATLSGGRIPGAPSSLPIPANITPDASGIEHYTFEGFLKLLETGFKPSGAPLDPFMPYAALSKMNDTEKRALWEYLRSLPPKKFGGR